jgi:hypothetical protein
LESNESLQFIHECKRAVATVAGGTCGGFVWWVKVCYWGGDKVICTYLGHIRCSPVPFLDDILKNEQVGKVSQKLVMVVLREQEKCGEPTKYVST